MEELKEVMTRLGIEPTEDELAKMIAVVDKNENGAVDFVEFLEMMKGREKYENNEDNMGPEAAFRIFDRDGDGLITEEEIRLTMRNLGEELTESEIKAMVMAADLNGDGLIDFQEFSTLLAVSGGGLFGITSSPSSSKSAAKSVC